MVRFIRVLISTLVVVLLATAAAALASAASARTVVYCDNVDNVRVKPKNCTFIVPGGQHGGFASHSVYLKIRWTRWGRRVAKGIGTYAGNMGYRVKNVRLKLYRPQQCGSGPGDGIVIFSRLRTTSTGAGGHADVMELSACGG